MAEGPQEQSVSLQPTQSINRPSMQQLEPPLSSKREKHVAGKLLQSTGDTSKN